MFQGTAIWLEPCSYAAERPLFGALPFVRCLRRHIPVDKASLLYAHSKDLLEELFDGLYFILIDLIYDKGIFFNVVNKIRS